MNPRDTDPRGVEDNVTEPDMLQAILTALGPQLEQTGEHKLLPDGYCPDCQGDCLRTWLPGWAPEKQDGAP